MTLKDFLTYELYEKYEKILPIIDLVIYYVSYDLYYELFGYDGLPPETKPTMRQQIDELWGIYGYFLHKLRTALYLKSTKKKKKVLCSDTVLLLDRYNGFIDSLSDACDIYSVMRYGDCRRTLQKKNDPLAERKKRFHQIYIGKNVEGKKLKQLIRMLYLRFMELKEEEKTCAEIPEEIDQLLFFIQKQVGNRVNRLKRKMKKKKIDMFITINQQRIKDIICIMACHELKIWTKEISHFSSFSYFQKPVRQTVAEHKNDIITMYVDESCQWSEWDKESLKIRNIYNRPLLVSVVGCVELSKETIKKKIANQKRENIIVFFTWNELVEYDPESHLICDENFKIAVYEKIAKLAEKYNYKVYVRRHPNIPLKKYEISLIEKYGFYVCPNTSNDLEMLLCKAKVAIGGGSSALIKARYCGLKCFNIIDQNDKEKNERANISLINWNNIDQIIIDDLAEIVVDYGDFIDIEKVLEFPIERNKV